MRFFILINFLFYISFNVFSQSLNQADELYMKGEYGIAQKMYIDLLEFDIYNDELYYKIANCSKIRDNKEAISWFNIILEKFPESIYYQLSMKELGLIYFSLKDYNNSYKFLSNIDQIELMDNEFLFSIGYSLFEIKKYDLAKYYFSKIDADINRDKYKILSTYYYAHICYLQKLYNTAEKFFLKLENNKSFSKIIPYYISQIYFSTGRYNKLIEYSLPILNDVIPSRESEICRMIAESYFFMDNYIQSEIYMKKYMQLGGSEDKFAKFQLGVINFLLNDYNESAIYLNDQFDSDSINQISSYYLAFSYLEKNEKIFSLNAFKKSSSFDYDLEIKEESLYNYFKLSYELDLPYTNLEYVLEQMEKYHFTRYKLDIEKLMINLFQSTNQYQQAFDFLRNNHLPAKEEILMLQRLSYYIGIQHYNNANYSKALVNFEFSRKNPVDKEIDAMCVYLLGDCYYQLRDYKKSIDNYISYLETPSSSLVSNLDLANYNLAYSYFHSKQFSKSIYFFRKILSSELDQARLDDSRLRLADSYFMEKNFQKALIYYNKSTINNKSIFEKDYSIYQESICNSLMSNYIQQEENLIDIVEEYTESPYYEKSLIDLAVLYKNQNRYVESVRYFDLIIDISVDEETISQCLLNKGLIMFNTEKIDSAIIFLKDIIENYANSSSFNSAKNGLKNAYLKLSNLDEYIDYIQTIPQINISTSTKDSLFFQVAYNNYINKLYKVSKEGFFNYLSEFGPKSLFFQESQYYYAESCWNTSDTNESIRIYKNIISSGHSEFFESSLVKVCRYTFNNNNIDESNYYYQLLDSNSSSHGLRRESVIRLMLGYEKIDLERSVIYAKRILESDKLEDRLLAKCKLIIARNEFDNGNYLKSSSICDEIVKITRNNDGAEAMYMKIYFTYLEDKIDESQQLIFDFPDDYHSEFWIAKAFILLSEIYVSQGNLFQAKATLESIIENYNEDDEVKYDAKYKWENIVKTQSIKSNNKKIEETIIEIGDEINYEVSFSEVNFEEDYKE